MRQTIRIISLLFAAVIFSALNPKESFAAGSPSGPPPPFLEFLGGTAVYWFNFLLYVLIVFLLLRRPFQRLYAARRDAIEERVLAGKRALEIATERLNQSEAKLSKLPDELPRISEEIKAETIKEVEELELEAKNRAERLLKLAKDSAEAEKKALENLVTQELVQTAMLLARERLIRELNEESDREYRSRLVATKVPELAALH